MDFRLELEVKPLKQQISLGQQVMLAGSCFTGHMAAKLSRYRFQVCENPHGILFNPVSISHALSCYASPEVYTLGDIFQYNGLWQSWHHHGRFASVNPEEALMMMNRETEYASRFLRSAHWLILTLGSAFVYELKAGSGYNLPGKSRVVGNCHKVPAQHFNHRLLAWPEVQEAVENLVSLARSINPAINIIFTVSPVRHHREGLIENNRSKGLLHNAVAAVTEAHENVFYFPAYELVIDDLRDYRFYAEDLVHPNYLATQYVWEKFSGACIDEKSRVIMERIGKINAALEHRPRQPESEQHKAFLQKMYSETLELTKQVPALDLSDALAFFSQAG